FSKICKDIPENLLLAGPINDGMTSAKELVKKLNIENRVFFITPKNNNELAVLYAAAEIYCHPSMYEGFGIPPIEAQKCGCPVISSNAASLSEILEDSAILFDYRNFDEFVEKLKELATDENLKKLIIAKGLKNSERFNAQKIYPKFFEVIDNFK
ncbi:MAG TPA: glycosyltransferase, partial [bacterium]|nr:glycosyltransferase [bacterium]